MKLSDPPKPNDIGASQTTVKRSQKHERGIAKATKGRRQIGSGAVAGYKGDVMASLKDGRDVLIEAKTTGCESHSVTQQRLVKISSEAGAYKRIPVYWLTFENMPHPYSKDWVMMPASVLGWKKT